MKNDFDVENDIISAIIVSQPASGLLELKSDGSFIYTPEAGFEGIDKRFDRVENRLNTLETGQEEIKLRLTNVAYRFEIVELENQVKSLTTKMKNLERLVVLKLKRQNNEA